MPGAHAFGGACVLFERQTCPCHPACLQVIRIFLQTRILRNAAGKGPRGPSRMAWRLTNSAPLPPTRFFPWVVTPTWRQPPGELARLVRSAEGFAGGFVRLATAAARTHHKHSRGDAGPGAKLLRSSHESKVPWRCPRMVQGGGMWRSHSICGARGDRLLRRFLVLRELGRSPCIIFPRIPAGRRRYRGTFGGIRSPTWRRRA